MLHQQFPPDVLERLLLDRDRWHPYPTIRERAAWASLPEGVRRAHQSIAEAHLGFAYPALPAVRFLDFSRNGNRTQYQAPHFLRRGVLEMLVTAECMEGEGRFLDDIVNGIWAICEESYWGVPAHIRVQRAGNTLPDVTEPTVDLFAAETGNLLAWADYLLQEELDTVSPLVRRRIAHEVDRRILTPLLERDDFPWMGFHLRGDGRRVNNWNPWICSNWLSCALLLETDPRRRLDSVAKILRTVDHFIDPYPADGGCDEGPSYWGRAGASLFDNLELLHSASDGRMDVYGDAKIREIGRFVYRVHIHDDYYLNFADAPALVAPDGVLVYRYGVRIGDEEMKAHGLWLIQRQGTGQEGYSGTGFRRPINFQRLLRGLFALADLPTATPEPPQVREVWLPDIQVMVARDRPGSAQGFFVGAKGGHNNESHNHNDVGGFVVYMDGRPLLVDAGVEEYTAKTFGPDRYQIWTMQSAYHNLLPTVDGIMQAPGFEFAATAVAYGCEDGFAQMEMDLAPAYPPQAQIARWRRSIRLVRGETLVVEDAYDLRQAVTEIALALITPCAVNLDRPGVVRLEPRPIQEGRLSAGGQVSFPEQDFIARVERVRITDDRLGGTWGEALYRVVLTARDPALQGRWRFVVSR